MSDSNNITLDNNSTKNINSKEFFNYINTSEIDQDLLNEFKKQLSNTVNIMMISSVLLDNQNMIRGSNGYESLSAKDKEKLAEYIVDNIKTSLFKLFWKNIVKQFNVSVSNISSDAFIPVLSRVEKFLSQKNKEIKDVINNLKINDGSTIKDEEAESIIANTFSSQREFNTFKICLISSLNKNYGPKPSLIVRIITCLKSYTISVAILFIVLFSIIVIAKFLISTSLFSSKRKM